MANKEKEPCPGEDHGSLFRTCGTCGEYGLSPKAVTPEGFEQAEITIEHAEPPRAYTEAEVIAQRKEMGYATNRMASTYIELAKFFVNLETANVDPAKLKALAPVYLHMSSYISEILDLVGGMRAILDK